MSKRDNHLLLMDMLDGAEKIQKYTLGINYTEFIRNEMVKDAVARNFEIIGEAANRIENDFRDANNHIEWIRIIGFRNRIIHDYFGIDYDILWAIIEDNIPILIDQLKDLIKNS